jgi:hypothetical protein
MVHPGPTVPTEMTMMIVTVIMIVTVMMTMTKRMTTKIFT